MTEPIFITAIIVSGIVALFWVVVHYACKLQLQERRQRAGHGSVQVQAGGSLTLDEAAIKRLTDERRGFDLS